MTVDDAALSEPHTWTGQWWLPDDLDDKVPGVLTYEPGGGMRLDLIGGWKPRDLEVENGTVRHTVTGRAGHWPIIHGVGDGKLITLLDSFGTQSYSFGALTIGAFGVPTKSRVVTNGILVNLHLDEAEQPVFEAAEVTVEHLTWWTRRTGITAHRKWGPGTQSLGDIELTRLEALSVDVDDVTVQLSTLPWPPHLENTRAHQLARVKEHVSIQFSASAPRPMAEWLSLLSGVSDLISLATLKPSANLTTRIYLPPTPGRYPEDHPFRDRRNEVLVFRQEIVTPDAGDPEVDIRDFLFTLEDAEFADVTQRWFRMRRTFRTAIGMVLGLRYITDGYLETRVVSAVAAAEAFHRELSVEPPLTKSAHKSLMKKLRAAVPEEHKAFVYERLPRNEPTLKTRLIELWSRVGDPASKLIPNPDAWATAAKDARNKLAHTGGTDAHTHAVLHAVAEVTAAVVVLNLLHEIGLSAERITEAVDRHSALRYASDLAHEHFGTA